MIDRIKLQGIQLENFNHYKNVGTLFFCPYCDWKCLKELNINPCLCQNHEFKSHQVIEYNFKELYDFYLNSISTCFIFGGLEPLLSFDELLSFIKYIRKEKQCSHEIIIYTGYYPNEIEDKLQQLKQYKNIIMKFGRFIPDRCKKYDEVLKIELISDNQYGEKIS